MPRKAKPPTGIILKIEGLSEPEVITPESKRVELDDFNGEPIEVITPEPKAVPIAPDHRKLKREADIQARTEKLSLLIRLGLVDAPDPIPPKPPKPAHNQRVIGGKLWTFTHPNALKRRI